MKNDNPQAVLMAQSGKFNPLMWLVAFAIINGAWYNVAGGEAKFECCYLGAPLVVGWGGVQVLYHMVSEV